MAKLATSPRHGSRDRCVCPRRLQRCRVRICRNALALLPKGPEIFRRDRRSGRQACDVRSQIHLRRRAFAAISDRISGWSHPSSVRRLGHAAQGSGWAALVSPLSGCRGHQQRSPALDQAEPELEFHVRRVPLDGRAQELRRRQGPFRHQLLEGGSIQVEHGQSRASTSAHCSSPSQS